MKISPARLAAFDILSRVENEGSYTSVLLPLHEKGLSGPDRGLCHELVMGVLRRQMFLDRIVGELAPRKLDSAVRIALRLGAYQLLFLDRIPAYSAINESVNLVQKARKSSAKGLVNAVLRKISTGVPTLKFTDDIERLSVETSHPRWLIESWIADFGVGEAERIAIADNAVAPTSFRFTRKAADHVRAAAYDRCEFVDDCFKVESIDDDLRSAAESGTVYFQEEASQLVARLVANNGGEKILDVCAAPGGKTSLIAASIDPQRTSVFAGDVHQSRTRLLRDNCINQGADFVNVIQYDASESIPFADGSFDSILVDAPCSGTGTIRNNPEIRYSLSEDDLNDLRRKQLAILRNASKLVSPGGRLVYSTCSLQKIENEGVCEAFLVESEDFESVSPDVPDRFRTEEGFARTFPHRDGIDGFFIAQFRRRVALRA
jgi:16S rRNA (cytosine967-C5)-methyltransferase